jgi:hypothetical protein
MGKDIFEVLTEYAINERLNDILQQDSEYQRVQREMDELIEQFHELRLPEEQNLLVDRLVSSHTESGCCYGRIAYRQGMRDCTSLLVEMGLIKDGREINVKE